jgi:serine/threonine protein kinase
LATGLLAFIVVVLFAIVMVLLLWKLRKRFAFKQESLMERLKEQEEEIDNAWRIEGDEIVLEQDIGIGTFGEVHLGKYRGIQVAIKILKANWTLILDESGQRTRADQLLAIQQFEAEIKCLRQWFHPNIVRCFGAGHFTEGKSFLVLEFCQRGSLDRILQNVDLELPWTRRLELALGAAEGINYLHHKKTTVLHRDIKSLNILVTENWTAKKTDFGTAKHQHNTMKSESSPSARRNRSVGTTVHNHEDDPLLDIDASSINVGSPLWSAPEVLEGKEATTRSDVYRCEGS